MNKQIKKELSKRLNPLNDYLFLKVMGEKGNEPQLLGFLNAALGLKGKDQLISVEIIENKTLSAEFLGAKTSILDVRAKLHNGNRVNIEVQLCSKENFNKRSLFYWGKEYTMEIGSGQDYINLPIVININIIDFDFLDTDNFHTIFRLREEKEHNLILTDNLEIHFINMVKWRKCSKIDIENKPLDRWLTWFDKNSPPELIEEIINMDEAIKAAKTKQEFIANDKESIREYYLRDMAIRDLNSGLSYARKEGIKEGITQIAGKMKNAGKSVAEIKEFTGLSPETIAQL